MANISVLHLANVCLYVKEIKLTFLQTVIVDVILDQEHFQKNVDQCVLILLMTRITVEDARTLTATFAALVRFAIMEVVLAL